MDLLRIQSQSYFRRTFVRSGRLAAYRVDGPGSGLRFYLQDVLDVLRQGSLLPWSRFPL